MPSVLSVARLAAPLLALAGTSDAFWRMPCRSRTGIARMDPLVEPGEIADHAHVIHGGGNFGMITTYEDLVSSNCTSCGVYEDKSAYWTPPMYFQHANGTIEMVEQVGGMLAYYLLYGQNIRAFPKGFRLLAGDARQRNFTWPVPDPPKSEWSGDQLSQKALRQKALGFNCLDYSRSPEGSLYRHFLPDKAYLDANCKDGIRLELMFPSCWNGKDIDSSDHKSHMAYPNLVNDGVCPDGFDVRLPSLFFETIWNTYAFKDVDGQFVLGNGDPTGYGYHGDFLAGWEEDFLQSAVETCTNPSGNIEDCPLFTLQSDSDAAQCTFDMPSELSNDDCTGPRIGLPGGVPIQSGPGYASGGVSQPTKTATPSHTTKAPAPTSSSAIVPTLSYKSGTSMVTDKYGGGITVARVLSATPLANGADSPAPTITSAPVEPSIEPVGEIISTECYTSSGAAYEIFVEEVVVTVTATTAPTYAPHHRLRHLHHARAHGFH